LNYSALTLSIIKFIKNKINLFNFQQTLPIVPKGSKELIVGACLQRSFLWPKIKVCHLTENMHVDRNDPESARFAEWLQNIGKGKDLPLEHEMKSD
jgi:PIF1-like helicase